MERDEPWEFSQVNSLGLWNQNCLKSGSTNHTFITLDKILYKSQFPFRSLVAQVKSLPAMQETQYTWVLSLGQKDPSPGGRKATHSSILAWKIPWTEDPDGLQFMGLQESDTTE